jgi:hypothetical protein
MSLDVYLNDNTGRELFAADITHNLAGMAQEAGVYEVLWRPEANDIVLAVQLIEPLRRAITELVTRPSHYKQFNASNNWGRLENFLLFCVEYLEACVAHPEATVQVSR